jgi:hypothetical protein
VFLFFAVDSNEEVFRMVRIFAVKFGSRFSAFAISPHPCSSVFIRGKKTLCFLRVFAANQISVHQRSSAVKYRVAGRRGWLSGLIFLRHSAPHRPQFTPQITQCVPYS